MLWHFCVCVFFFIMFWQFVKLCNQFFHELFCVNCYVFVWYPCYIPQFIFLCYLIIFVQKFEFCIVLIHLASNNLCFHVFWYSSCKILICIFGCLIFILQKKNYVKLCYLIFYFAQQFCVEGQKSSIFAYHHQLSIVPCKNGKFL
jgi:hypothetical protein